MKKIKDKIYLIGVVITFLSLAGISESFTGHGSMFWGIVWFIIGLTMVLQGYIK